MSWRSPPRLSRCRVVWPLEAGIGATPARRAKAASERTRPWCDQATISCAATIGPTPGSSSSVGASARTWAWISCSSSSASTVAAFARRARLRRTSRVVTSSAAPGLRRKWLQRSSSFPLGSARSSCRSWSGAVTITARSCANAWRRTSTAPRRAISSRRSASRRSPLRGRAFAAPASAARAVSTASSLSSLPRRRRLLPGVRLTSSTVSSRPARKRASPAP